MTGTAAGVQVHGLHLHKYTEDGGQATERIWVARGALAALAVSGGEFTCSARIATSAPSRTVPHCTCQGVADSACYKKGRRRGGRTALDVRATELRVIKHAPPPAQAGGREAGVQRQRIIGSRKQ